MTVLKKSRLTNVGFPSLRSGRDKTLWRESIDGFKSVKALARCECLSTLRASNSVCLRGNTDYFVRQLKVVVSISKGGFYMFRFLVGVSFLLIVAVPHVFAGANANAVVSLDWILDGGAGNQTDDGVHSGNVSGQGTKIAVEVFAQGVTTSLIGVKIEFDFDAAVLKFDGAANSAFAFIIPEVTGVNFAGAAPVTLPKSSFLARAEFSTVADVTGKEFHLGIKSVTLAESAVKSDVVTSTSRINFNGVETTGTDTTGTDTGVNGLGAVNANVLFSPNAITATANTEVSIDVFIYGVNSIGGQVLCSLLDLIQR